MISREWLRQNPDLYRKALVNRRANIDLDQYLAVEVARREIITNVEMLKARKNAASQEIAKLKKQKLDAAEQITEMKRVGDDIAALEQKLSDVEESLRSMELVFPNVPDASVPVGPDETANRVERVWGKRPSFDFEPLQHFDIGERLGIIDFQRAAKITGARFAVLFGAGAELERALTAFMLDVHTKKHGYTEVLPPFMVNADSLLGTGQLPKFEEDLFKLQGEKNYYLIPTAEVPVTNLLRDEIVSEEDLPISYCAYTPCFRSEAGSYGKDTRGLIRQHQFDKVELVKFSKPDESWRQLERLTADAAEILELLGLHHRVVTLSTGDMGFGSAKTYDIEVWLPGQDAFREISSCTNFTDFQARRANIRYKGATTKTTFVHTLNGSGLAVGRTLVAVLENYQQADGTVLVPPALQPYMSGAERITARK